MFNASMNNGSVLRSESYETHETVSFPTHEVLPNNGQSQFPTINPSIPQRGSFVNVTETIPGSVFPHDAGSNFSRAASCVAINSLLAECNVEFLAKIILLNLGLPP